MLCPWGLLANSEIEGHSYLLNFPFQPASAQPTSESTDTPTLVLDYTTCDPRPSDSKPSVHATPLDIPSLSLAGCVKHVFAKSGPKARPVRFDVNGRKGRRAICVLYGDAMRYDVLDLDAGMEDEEDGDEVEIEG